MKALIAIFVVCVVVSTGFATTDREPTDAQDLAFALAAVGAVHGTTDRDLVDYFVTRFEKSDYSLLRRRSDVVREAKKLKADSIVDIEPNHLSQGFRYWVYFREDTPISMRVEPTEGKDGTSILAVSAISPPELVFKRLQLKQVEISLKQGSWRNAYKVERQVEPGATDNPGDAQRLRQDH